MIVGLDFYGVIANHLAAKVAFARTAWGLTITEAEATRELLKQRLGETDYRRFALEFEARPLEERLSLPLYEDVPSVLNGLANEGDRFVVVSWQFIAELKPVLDQYFAQHGLPIRALEVTMSDDEKRNACLRQGVQLFFDDNRSVLELVRPLGITLVWANFYHHAPGQWNGLVAHSWREFAKIVRDARRAR